MWNCEKIPKEIIRLPLPTFIYFRTKILVWIMFCLQCLDSVSHFVTKSLFGLCFHMLFPTLSVNKMQFNCCKKSTGSCCSRSDATSSQSFRDSKRVSEEIILSAFQSFYVLNVQMEMEMTCWTESSEDPQDYLGAEAHNVWREVKRIGFVQC